MLSGVPTTIDVERHAEDARARLVELDRDPLPGRARVRVHGVGDRLHVRRQLRGLLRGRGRAREAVTGVRAAEHRPEERVVGRDVRVELDGARACSWADRPVRSAPPGSATRRRRVSDCVLERYGQNVTESESEMPAGQLASATGEPFTGFSGIGGLNVRRQGSTCSATPPGPVSAAGSAPRWSRRGAPSSRSVRRRASPCCWLRPSSVVLRTPNALSVTLLCVTDEAAAPTRRTPAPRRRFWLFSAWLPSAIRVVVRGRARKRCRSARSRRARSSRRSWSPVI